MFVCPNCGYRDKPCWRAHKWMLYVVYCTIDDLESFQPALAEKLRETADVEEGPYAYHLGKTGYVLRVAKELKAFLYEHNLVERYTATQHPDQKKIDEVAKAVPPAITIPMKPEWFVCPDCGDKLHPFKPRWWKRRGQLLLCHTCWHKYVVEDGKLVRIKKPLSQKQKGWAHPR